MLDAGVDLPLFFKGLIVGFGIAVPVGPIALLCIQRSINNGWLAGLASGLGAALADSYYGAIAALGVSLVQDFLFAHRRTVGLLGGALLCLIGVRILLSRRRLEPAKPKRDAVSLLGDFASAFLLTLANPTTILAFIAIFAAVGAGSAGGTFEAAMTLVLGVLAGSALWWSCLAFGVGTLRHRLDESARRWITRGSAAMMIAFGLYVMGQGLLR